MVSVSSRLNSNRIVAGYDKVAQLTPVILPKFNCRDQAKKRNHDIKTWNNFYPVPSIGLNNILRITFQLCESASQLRSGASQVLATVSNLAYKCAQSNPSGEIRPHICGLQKTLPNDCGFCGFNVDMASSRGKNAFLLEVSKLH